MPDPTTSPWPGDLFDFAFIPAIDDQLHGLADLAEVEDWTYQHTHNDHPYPILFNFVRYTYRRVAEESKISGRLRFGKSGGKRGVGGPAQNC